MICNQLSEGPFEIGMAILYYKFVMTGLNAHFWERVTT